jgi:hypothetical protein
MSNPELDYTPYFPFAPLQYESLDDGNERLRLQFEAEQGRPVFHVNQMGDLAGNPDADPWVIVEYDRFRPGLSIRKPNGA